jgi:hypothetical protein
MLTNDLNMARPIHNDNTSYHWLSGFFAFFASILLIPTFVVTAWILPAVVLGYAFGPVLYMLQKNNVSRILGCYEGKQDEFLYGDSATYRMVSSNRHRLWKKYNSLHADIRRDVGSLTLDRIKNMPESQANSMYSRIDNLETAYWEHKNAQPDLVVQDIFRSIDSATKTYQAETKTRKEISR